MRRTEVLNIKRRFCAMPWDVIDRDTEGLLDVKVSFLTTHSRWRNQTKQYIFGTVRLIKWFLLILKMKVHELCISDVLACRG